MKDNIYYFAHFNLDALLALSETCRGRPCSCDVSQTPKSGCLNWVIFITFDDGVEWVFRSPRDDLIDFYKDETSSKILLSEVSTLLYLKANTSVPVPDVYSFSGSGDNEVGVPYILQSKATGRSLGSYDWSQTTHEVPGVHRLPRLPISDKDREKVMVQLGAIMSELSRHRFDKIGSLMNEVDYLNASISAFTSHVRELPLTPHVFIAPVPDKLDYKTFDSYRTAGKLWNDFVTLGQKIDHSKNMLSYCIAGQILREMIPHLSSGSRNGFTLSHPDLHLGNLYVDDDFNITCVIDWSSTTTGPVTELLTPPSLGSSNTPPSGFLAAAFRTGFSQEAAKISSNVSYSNLWEASKRLWYFSRLIRLLSKNDFETFRRLYELVYKINAGEEASPKEILWLFHERANRGENKVLLVELQQDDMEIEEVQERERGYFIPNRTENTADIAVARKLTLMSEMNPGFLADHILWQWVDEACKQDGEL
ncbi:hypothetical protein HJFPF1_11430 [Paramyrothecium foliicola]|nr:hypothetical protein HJFPF1_11430 [Paramyrothecium foliicola]